MSQIVMGVLASGSALAGVVITSIFAERSTEKQNKLQSLKQQQEWLRSSGEDLYNMVSKWAGLVLSSHMGLYSVMRGEISYNQHLDIHINSLENKDYDPHRMELLIHAYFPKLIPQYKQTRMALEEHNKIVGDHKQSYKQGDDGSSFIKPFQKAQIKFEQESDELKRQIIEQISTIDR